MNKKVISMFTAGTFALLFTACGDTLVDADNPPINTTAKLNVFVVDNDTGEPIGGATVKLISTGESAVTDASNGGVNFSNVYTGSSHTVLVEKVGYASISSTANIDGSISENNYIADENTVKVSLYPKTASLDGYLYYPDTIDASKSNPAAGAKIVIRYNNSSNILNKYDTTTVDAGGKFAFSNLAAGAGYTLTPLPFTVGSYTDRKSVV
jgi:hypothetical protein